MSQERFSSGERLRRAKRRFIANLVFFIGLLVAGWLLYTGTPEDSGKKAPEPIIEPRKPLPLPELAYLKGQMAALSEHPATLPVFEEAWVRTVCRKMILREASFADAPEGSIELLVDAYYRGYEEHFHEYFDDHAARQFGLSYGLKFDPLIHGVLKGGSRELLEKTRGRVELEFGIRDEAEWRLFGEAFDRGFQEGYPMIKEGVTVHSLWDKIRLFED